MIHCRRTTLFLLLMVCAFGKAADINVKFLDSTFGLSSDYVVDLAIDKMGLLWVATEDGLNRFDGNRFINYTKRNGLTGNELNCLLDDPKANVMWIGTQRDGLDWFDYSKNIFGTFQHRQSDAGSLITNDITSLSTSADGNAIWITTYWHGVDQFQRSSRRFVHYNTSNVKGMPSDRLWCVLDAGGGILYVGHDSNGMTVIDTHTRQAHNFQHDDHNVQSISGNEVRCIFRDRQGRVWVGTNKGLDLFDPLSGSFTHFSDNGRLNSTVFCIHELPDGQLLIGTEQDGMVSMTLDAPFYGSSANASFFYLTEGDPTYELSGKSVRGIKEDPYHNFWLGLYGAGINFISNRPQQFYNIEYSPIDPNHHLSVKEVLSLDFDSKGNLWVGMNGDGINVFNPEMARVPSMEKLRSKFVQVLKRDSWGNMWAGTYEDNLYKITPDGRIKAIFSNNTDVRAVLQDGDKLLVGTSVGLYVVNITSEEVVQKITLPENLIRCIKKDDRGFYWVGTFGGGLMVCDAHFKVRKQYYKSNGIPSNTVNAILASKGTVWVATAEGLVKFVRGKATKTYDNAANLADLNVRAIYLDRRDNLWLSTSRTLSCLRRGTDRLINYDYNDFSNRGNFSAAAVAMASNGNLFFGSTKGITYFDPDLLLARQNIPHPIISEAIVGGGARDGSDSTLVLIGKDEMRLPYKDNNFSLHFSQPDYFLHGSVEYAYRLKGLRNDWETTRLGEVTFSNVPYGDYTLEVRCRLHNQQWTTRITTLSITVLPPLWLTWWAKFIYVLLIGAVVVYVSRLYRNRLRLAYELESEKRQREQEMKLNNERMSFFTNITHELRTPLTLILGPLDDLSHDGSIPQKEKHELAIIYHSAIRLRDLIGRILDFRKTETGNRRLAVVYANIVDTVREVVLKYEELDNEHRVPIRFIAPKPIIKMWHDPEVVRIIVDNLVSNAIKYTREGGIDVSVEMKSHDGSDLVELAVSDTGYGISEGALPHVFDSYYQEDSVHQASGTGIGLSLVKNLVELHHGTIRVESKINEGSTFIVDFDADETYPQALRGVEKENKIEVSSPKEEDREEVAAQEDSQRDGKKIVLIVEDDRDIRDYIADSLDGKMDVHVASNGKEGLGLTQALMPDIIVSDIMMPRMDGNEMCRAIKKDGRTSHIPVILLTAKSSDAAREEGYDSGADSYITKPFSVTLLKIRINNLLAQRSRILESVRAVQPNAEAAATKRKILEENIRQADREFFDKLNELINKNISGDTDIDSITRALGMSTSSLYRKMRQMTGMGTNEYVRRYKMHYAEKLLLEGKYTISEIAFMVGMNSAAYFRKCFKEEFGDIPSVYIKRIKGEKNE
ncbi:two-component regulator propeller domain-containing protein [Hallella multisaccharivorax]|uniref:hybrid sensor histidine kinase/response regulator transcription factor n=1 Tax=Hallella multisaccharivorax TaxID=310514 RepID=UPI0036175949